MTLDQLRELARTVGFPDPDLAAAVAMAESGGHEAAVGDKGNSFGLWQIHHPSHPQFEPSLLLTPYYNATAAMQVSHAGKDWTPWSVFTHDREGKYVGPGNGYYKEFLPAPAPVLPAPPVAGELERAVAATELDPDDTTEVTAVPSGDEPDERADA